MSDYLAELRLATNSAELAGDALRKEYDKGSITRSAVGKDIKLQADLDSETIILDELQRYSTYPILSEEAGADAQFADAGVRWIVDPLDGTYNYSRRIPLCCVSIALWKGPHPLVGVVCDFLNRITYSGVVGVGAWRNADPMQVSGISEKSQAVLCTGLPIGLELEDSLLRDMVFRMYAYKKTRMLGSAALSLAYVASGCADVYQESHINYWDVAAGLALVVAAGGAYSLGHLGHYQDEVYASNGRILWG